MAAHVFALQPTIQLDCYRCTDCKRWFACESTTTWRCGSCQETRNADLQAKLTELSRTISALRGAVTRRQKGQS